MSLALYKKKRSFKRTPEPSGKKAASGPELRFVVQKHDASHLHYDFRLQMEGVLKSWAVPKGPSMDPGVKRLAMMVEDHPYDYRNFEGIIPEGNYGAGTVMIWDEGSYEPAEPDPSNKKSPEKNLLHQLHSGRLKFIMHGKKLKGEFALVKASGRGENAWLLMKLNDKYAAQSDITKKDKSARSGKTITQIASTSKNFFESNRKTKIKAGKKAAAAGVKKKSSKTDEAIAALLEKGRKTPMPADIRPMLATLADEVFDDPGWLYEVKWDGYRALSYLYSGTAELRSRNNLSFNDKFRSVTEALKEWHVNAIVDGEIIAINEKGHADFQQLQGFAKKGQQAELVYYVFDLIWYEGKNITGLPLTERKTILQSIVPADHPVIRYSDHVIGNGKSFFDVALKQGLEGILAKKTDSEYVINFRTRNWLKIKHNKKLEAIICGFTKPRRSRKYFGAIILGKYFGDELKYVGHSGSGFDDEGLREMSKKFEPLITGQCPFKTEPKTNMPVTWLKPELVCEVKFTEWTDEQSLRHPIYLGLREDKTAREEKNEIVVHAPVKKTKMAKSKTAAAPKTKKIVSESAKSPAPKTAAKKPNLPGKILLPENSKEELLTIQKHELKFTNLNKLYWPKEKISKRDMLNYYYAVMPYIFPYMKDRPQSLNRHPNGINGPNFYQKDVGGKVADWIKTYSYLSESDGETKQFLVCSDEATLLYIANLGCIEMNPWHSRTQSADHPDWCVIDLDPDGNPFSQVIEVALTVKNVLDAVDVPAYCKTSGATGMHIYIPFGARYSYDQSRMLAELIVGMVHQQIPSFTSVERSPAKRKKKIYLDFLQNRSIQTIAAPYSLRPKPGATVSTPLHWEELNKGIKPADFTIYNTLERLKKEGDIFKPVLGKGINLEQALKKIDNLTGQHT